MTQGRDFRREKRRIRKLMQLALTVSEVRDAVMEWKGDDRTHGHKG